MGAEVLGGSHAGGNSGRESEEPCAGFSVPLSPCKIWTTAIGQREGSERIREPFKVPQLPPIRQRIRTELALPRASIRGWGNYRVIVFRTGGWALLSRTHLP